MAENKNKDPLENTLIPDEMLFDPPMGLPAWAAELDIAEEDAQIEVVDSLLQFHSSDLDNKKAATEELIPNCSAETKEQIVGFSDKQEDIEIPKESLEEYILKTEESIFESPIGEPEFLREPVSFEENISLYSDNESNEKNVEAPKELLEEYSSVEQEYPSIEVESDFFDIPTEEPDFFQTSSTVEEESSQKTVLPIEDAKIPEENVFETPNQEPWFFQESSVAQKEYHQNVILPFAQTREEENAFEAPIGEPGFFQESMKNHPDLQNLNTTNSAEIIPFTQPIEVKEDEETNLSAQKEVLAQDSQTLSQNILDTEIAALEIISTSEGRIGALESVIANIDKDINYLDFDVDSQSLSPSLEVKRYLSFFLDGTNYAIDAHNVLEMNKVPKITFVPNVMEWVAGVTNLRGDILAVIDMRSFLGLAPLERRKISRLLVVRNNNSSVMTGIIVDEVKGLREVPVSKIATLPDFYLEEKLKPFFKGVYKSQHEMLALLDMELFLTSPELRQFELI